MGERGWYYFGCHQRAGHYLFDRNMRTPHYHDGPKLIFDGTLCLPECEGLYIAALARLGGPGYSVLAFWDRTVDKRGGSNRAIFAPSLTCSPESILRGAEAFFPTVFKRWPKIDLTRANEQYAAMMSRAAHPADAAAQGEGKP